MEGRHACGVAQDGRTPQGSCRVPHQPGRGLRSPPRNHRGDGAGRRAARQGLARHTDGRDVSGRVFVRGRAGRSGCLFRQDVLLPGGHGPSRVAGRRQFPRQGRAGRHAIRQFDLHRLPAPIRLLPRNRAALGSHHGSHGLPDRADAAAVPRADHLRRDGRIWLPLCRHGLLFGRSGHGRVRPRRDAPRPVSRADRRRACQGRFALHRSARQPHRLGLRAPDPPPRMVQAQGRRLVRLARGMGGGLGRSGRARLCACGPSRLHGRRVSLLVPSGRGWLSLRCGLHDSRSDVDLHRGARARRISGHRLHARRAGRQAGGDGRPAVARRTGLGLFRNLPNL